jgi:hypothetical protein
MVIRQIVNLKVMLIMGDKKSINNHQLDIWIEMIVCHGIEQLKSYYLLLRSIIRLNECILYIFYYLNNIQLTNNIIEIIQILEQLFSNCVYGPKPTSIYLSSLLKTQSNHD